MITITRDRIRSIIAAAHTERELVSLLRSHKIRFSFTIDDGGNAVPVRIPAKTGPVIIRQNRSRFEIHGPAPVPYNPNTI